MQRTSISFGTGTMLLSSATSIRVASVAMTATLGILQGCHSCPDDRWQPSTSFDLAVSSNLHAVTAAAELGYAAIAVGAAGTVVAWDYGSDVETSTVADVDLRGVTDAGGGRWIVVGDGGFAASSDDYGQTWTTLDLQTSSDLHAAVTVRESVVVGGDEVVRVLQGDTWLEPPTPEGGWGQLRGIGASDPSQDPIFFAVGLGGVIWSTDDPSGVWVAEDSGVGTDLLAVGPLQYSRFVAVGANGTFLIRDAGEWSPIETNRTIDFIDYQDFDSYGLLLTADGEVLEYISGGFEHVDQLDGARDLAIRQGVFDGLISGIDPGLIAVGDAGMAVTKILEFCE